MIARFNQKQMVLGILSAVGGLACGLFTWAFFHFVTAFVAKTFGYRLSSMQVIGIDLILLGLVFGSGYWQWRSRGGFCSYYESDLYHHLGEDTGGAVAVNHYVHRVTAPAYLISQIILGAPLLTLRSLAYFRRRITPTPGLEMRLNEVLKILQQANKWQSATEYPGFREEIFLLAKMGLIDFSARQGARIKAYPVAA